MMDRVDHDDLPSWQTDDHLVSWLHAMYKGIFMSYKYIPIIALASICMAGMAYGQKTANDKTMATVNGIAIPQSQADILLSDQQAAGVAASPELTAAIRKEMILRSLQVQQAKAAKLDKDPALQERVHMASDEVMQMAWRQAYVRQHPASKEEIAAAYDDIKNRAGSQEFHVRGLLLSSEATAKDIIAHVKSKGSLADYLSQSLDASSRAKGGDLGWINLSNVQPAVAKAIAAAGKPGLLDAPVQGTAGWHVLQIEEVRPFAMPALDGTVSQHLAAEVARRKLESHLAELYQSAKIQ